MIKHFRFVDITIINFEYINQFDNLEKLKMINKLFRDFLKNYQLNTSKSHNTKIYIEFINKFYNDKTFCYLFSEYQKSHDIFIRPSLDHIYPISLGGKSTLDNVRIISWFENRCKNNLVLSDWEYIKKNIHYYLNDREE